MTAQSQSMNRYGFVVPRSVNKVEIKKAVEQMYGVTVISVNTMVTPGKSKSRSTKRGVVQGTTATSKKAVVTLIDGDMIDFYSNI